MTTLLYMATDPNTKRMTVVVPKELHKRIRLAAAEKDWSLNETIIACLLKCFPPEQQQD